MKPATDPGFILNARSFQPAPLPRIRKTDNLRLGRVSRTGARYFVTLVTKNRERWLLPVGASLAKPAGTLNTPPTPPSSGKASTDTSASATTPPPKPFPANIALDVLRAGHDARDWRIAIATCMPDHLHVLFTLGPRLTVGQCVARWKFQIRQAVGTAHAWQRDFWEHRIPPEENHEDYGSYVFLNPYRAKLISSGQTWPWTWMPDPASFYFSGHLRKNGTPQPEWIGQSQECCKHLKTHAVGASLAKPAGTRKNPATFPSASDTAISTHDTASSGYPTAQKKSPTTLSLS